MIPEPVNLTSLKKDEFKKFLSGFDHVFTDCDGVIWNGPPPHESARFLELIKKIGKTVNYVSNNSLRSKEGYEKLFQSINIDDGYENLTVPSTAINEYLKSKNFDKHVYCITNSETKHILESNGFKCKSGPDLGPEHLEDFVQFFDDDEDIGAVAFDFDPRVNPPKLYKACTYLKRPEVLFLNGATDRMIPVGPGRTGLGVQGFTDLVIEVVKREPIQLAKPSRQFGELAMKRAGVTDASRVLFIGDMIQQDIGVGKNTGFKTLLVLTSASKEDMMAETKIRPDYYAPSLGSIVPLLESLL